MTCLLCHCWPISWRCDATVALTVHRIVVARNFPEQAFWDDESNRPRPRRRPIAVQRQSDCMGMQDDTGVQRSCDASQRANLGRGLSTSPLDIGLASCCRLPTCLTRLLPPLTGQQLTQMSVLSHHEVNHIPARSAPKTARTSGWRATQIVC